MGVPIFNSPFLGHLVEYNGYKFSPRCKTQIGIRSNEDESKRIETSRTYFIKVSGYITPRRPIPGDESGNGIQLMRPNPQVPAPGYDPFHAFATTDSEINIVRCKLTEQGKTLRYTGNGMGDLYVNTLNPNNGQFIQDLNFGPKCRINILRPVGFNKSWYIEWECETTIQSCCSSGDLLNYNIPAKRIQEFNYAVSYNINSDGYARRTITGKLVIIPPMYRENFPLLPLGAINPKNADTQKLIDDYNNALADLSVIQANLSAILFDADVIVKSWADIVDRLDAKTQEKIAALIPQLVIMAESGATAVQMSLKFMGIVGPVISEPLSDLIIKKVTISNNLTSLYLDLKVAEQAVNIAAQNMIKLVKISDGIAKTPTSEPLFLSSNPDLIPINLTFGPYKEDNIGNLQNYETVDQYRELISNSIIIPFNHHRIEQRFDVSIDKRTMRFSIIDEEKPSFSFVPGYSKVTLNQNTSSSQVGFHKWSSTLTGAFKLPKFINANNAKSGYSKIDYSNDTIGKIFPLKIQAFQDFMKVVFQRFALSLAKSNSVLKVSIPNPNMAPGQASIISRELNVGAIFPVKFSVNENVLDNEISFSITYSIIQDMRYIWQMTGHGLPCILCADLGGSNKINSLNSDPVLRYAGAIFFSNYTDSLIHKDWLISQQFSSVSPRGSGNLILDRTYDKPINSCNSGFDINTVIPIHGDSSNPLAILGKATKSFTDIITFNSNNIQSTSSYTQQEYNNYKDFISGLVQGGSLIGSFLRKIPILNSQYDIDLFLEDDFAINGYPGQNAPDTVIGQYSTATFENNQSFGQTEDVSSFLSGLDNTVNNKILDAMGPPSPENSWILYESDLELLTENKILRHKLLPKFDLSPQSPDYNLSTYIENHWDDLYPLGPDNVVGESLDSTTYLDNQPLDDIIQIAASPSNTIRLIGSAMRVGYQVIPPTLITYGGKRAYQRKRRVIQRPYGLYQSLVYVCAWEIEYILAGTPIGPLNSPDNPLLRDLRDKTTEEDTIPAQEEDIFMLTQEFTNFGD